MENRGKKLRYTGGKIEATESPNCTGTEALCYLPTVTVQGDTKKWELLKNPTKLEEIQEKKNY